MATEQSQIDEFLDQVTADTGMMPRHVRADEVSADCYCMTCVHFADGK